MAAALITYWLLTRVFITYYGVMHMRLDPREETLFPTMLICIGLLPIHGEGLILFNAIRWLAGGHDARHINKVIAHMFKANKNV